MSAFIIGLCTFTGAAVWCVIGFVFFVGLATKGIEIVASLLNWMENP